MTQSKPALMIDAHVVILNNYIRRHHVASYKALARKVRKLTVLLSTPMEPDRDWNAEWDDLDVRIQKNWMFNSKWKHPSGFEEPNFIHLPVDTIRQLRKLKPDIIFSYEMGMRSFLCSMYRRFSRRVPVVVVGNMSQQIERERGLLRRTLRKFIRLNVDYCTFNGPSCKRYLESIGFSEEQLFHFPYCFDPDKSLSNAKRFSGDGVTRISYAGALSQRKGILGFTRQLSHWCSAHSDRMIEFILCGTGELKEPLQELAAPNLKLEFKGNCDNAQLRETFGRTDIFAFPTLADEWGLAPVEAMASGIPVLASPRAQSMEEFCVEGVNGWLFEPEIDSKIFDAINRALSTDVETIRSMGISARKSVEHITPERTADKFCQVIKSISRSSKWSNVTLKASPIESPAV